MKYFITLLIAAGITGSLLSQGLQKNGNFPIECVSAEELKLYTKIMEYRKKLNLPVIPLSASLTHVAHEHCVDLHVNKPDLGEGCNAHSWSEEGDWTACCYTPDHKKAECMWSKPKELTGYTGFGFEIACGSSEPQYEGYVMTADYALESWKKSKGHNAVIINQTPWKGYSWNAIGIGIYKGFAVVWFGTQKDGMPEPEACR